MRLQVLLLIFSVSVNLRSISALASPSSHSSSAPFALQKLDHIVLRCHDYPRMFAFYTNVLGCTIDKQDDVGRFGGALTHLRAGEAYIDLLAYDPKDLTEDGEAALLKMHNGGQGASASLRDIEFSASKSTMDHICLRIEPFDQKAIENYMKNQGVEIISSGDRKGADGVGPAIYVQDPEGHVIELKGPPKQTPSFDVDKKQASDNASAVSDKLDPGLTPPPPQIEGESSLVSSPPKEESDGQPSDFAVTPCVRICRYNSDFYGGQVCLGCFREAFEIETWSGMNPTEKYFTLLDAADRCPDDSVILFEGSTTRNKLIRQANAWNTKSD